MKRLGIVVVVLLVLAVVVDRVADWGAQRVVASSLQDSQGLDEAPDVDITGFPFLTQLAGGSFDRVEVGVEEYSLAGGAVDMTDIDLTFRDVSRDGDTVRATSVSGTGMITYAEISAALPAGAAVSYAGDGALDVAVEGVQVTVTPKLDGGEIGFTRAGGGSLVGAALSVPLSGLPFQVTAAGLEAEKDGLHLSMRGRDLAYSS